ncbi:MAG: hypothetical protein LBU43_07375 [Candidatus Accumulibacter sp.]|nr:hypothetical protein [Accumulibacter sp.]
MIAQIRNYDGTVKNVEDIGAKAANAADMKAAASGAPLILGEQVKRLDVRLPGMIQVCDRIAGTPDPGRFSLPATKQAWQTNQAKVQMRLKSLNARLEAVRGIEEGMGVLRPKIEELAVRKMRADRPVLAVEWDTACEQARRNTLTKGDKPIGYKKNAAVKR